MIVRNIGIVVGVVVAVVAVRMVCLVQGQRGPRMDAGAAAARIAIQ